MTTRTERLKMKNHKFKALSCVLLLLRIFPLAAIARPFILVLSHDYLNLKEPASSEGVSEADQADFNFDDFIDSEAKPDYNLDLGSWSPIFERGYGNSPYFNSSENGDAESDSNYDPIYYSGVMKMVMAASRGDEKAMAEAAAEIEGASAAGHPHSQSLMGFLYRMGIMRERSKSKAFLQHYFAAAGGNMQSKMALAYTYYR